MAEETPKTVEELADVPDDFSRWYLDVIQKAQLADYAPGARLHRVPPVRLRDLGAHAAPARRAHQGDRP